MVQLTVTCGEWNIIQITVRVRVGQIDGRRNDAIANDQKAGDDRPAEFSGNGRAMANFTIYDYANQLSFPGFDFLLNSDPVSLNNGPTRITAVVEGGFLVIVDGAFVTLRRFSYFCNLPSLPCTTISEFSNRVYSKSIRKNKISCNSSFDRKCR